MPDTFPEKDRGSKRYYLSEASLLRWLEVPSVYNVKTDELYEVDERGFSFLQGCASEEGCYSNDPDFIHFCLQENILGTVKVPLRDCIIRRSPVPSLRYLELLVTDRCNLRCRHCYIGEPEFHDLPFDAVKVLLEEFHAIQGLRVLVSGGEPLLYRDFGELNSFFETYPPRKVLLSNGTLLTGERLRGLNVEEIQISIDGIDASHDSIRGEGSYGKAMQGLQEAVNAGFDVSVSTMIHPMNLEDFEEMEGIFREMGVREWTVDVPCTSGRMEKNRGLCLPPETAGRYLRYGYGGGFHGGGDGYACGLHLASVLPDGRVAKCAFYADRPVGHISEGLETCWKRIEPLKLTELSCDCDDIEICRGGCRYRAELMGDPLGKDIFKCSAFRDER
ncbi:antilisterial bacteriocin subtilosin biosynthesis protein AlbA [bacterium BMS3Bbin06]|nr:antilisterial bacteriocin subtilosin biosynthesis protein AlbA [bacterium BMS3Abin08]GBE34458.1 antilisterial bacteriocin subtilosin biosynthesis protein AlbA [bacterium BMS3Bbin06]HDO35355.1 radical SAM protein [Nitrospirota bacterium]HDY71700.1 radical SAM protein [Nitrospirota bacterium]